jgi:hypothetical protein
MARERKKRGLPKYGPDCRYKRADRVEIGQTMTFVPTGRKSTPFNARILEVEETPQRGNPRVRVRRSGEKDDSYYSARTSVRRP